MKQRVLLLLSLFIVCIIPGFAQEQPFYFAVIADTQLGMHASNRNFEQETASYEFAVATINRLKPEFVIVLGDLVNKEGDTDQIREFLRITRKIDPFIPVHYVAGNHDVGAVPTPELLAAYRRTFGSDYYGFREGPVYGIVLNSSVMIAPQKTQAEYDSQLSWLKKELETAKETGARHVIVFQHHPFFLEDAKEADAWGNVPLERRQVLLDLLHDYGVKAVFAGHVHSHSVAKDRDLEMVAVGPVAMPFDEYGSGMMLVAVAADGIQYRYFDFGKLPNTLTTK